MISRAVPVARWDLLLSPNQASTARVRGAFRSDGRIVETGYPRNDLLVDPAGTEVRDAVRCGLGVRPGRSVEYFDTAGEDLPTALGLGTCARLAARTTSCGFAPTP